MNAEQIGTAVIDEPAPGVRRIAIHRPWKRNALDFPTRFALFDAVRDAVDGPSVRAIILTGSGGAFCAGGDLDSMRAQTTADVWARMTQSHMFVRGVANATKPVVTAIEGPAIGAGAGLALLGDLIVAGRGAMFGFPFVKLGLVPDWGLMHTLPARIGVSAARRLLMLGVSLSGAEAAAQGVADEVVDDDTVQARAVELAVRLAEQAPMALAFVRQGVALAGGLDDVLKFEASAQSCAMAGPEFQEGVQALRERRKPSFAVPGTEADTKSPKAE